MTPELASARNKLVIMVIASTVAFVAAGGFAVGHFVYNVGWMLPAFAAALVGGVASQIWFIFAVARPNKGA